MKRQRLQQHAVYHAEDRSRCADSHASVRTAQPPNRAVSTRRARRSAGPARDRRAGVLLALPARSALSRAPAAAVPDAAPEHLRSGKLASARRIASSGDRTAGCQLAVAVLQMLRELVDDLSLARGCRRRRDDNRAHVFRESTVLGAMHIVRRRITHVRPPPPTRSSKLATNSTAD